MAIAYKDVLDISGAMVDNDHIVYKAGKHGPAYINKEKFPVIGARNLVNLTREVAVNAVEHGLTFDSDIVGVIGPAYGAIPYALTLAAALEEMFPRITFFPARTEVITEKKIHVIPEKQKELYRDASFATFEDIVNNGTTIREVNGLWLADLNITIKVALCFVDRGGQTTESLGVEQYFPWMRVDMEQYDASKYQCPMCKEGVPINTKLGKGARWVKLFGQPPYPKDMDFSAFWEAE